MQPGCACEDAGGVPPRIVAHVRMQPSCACENAVASRKRKTRHPALAIYSNVSV